MNDHAHYIAWVEEEYPKFQGSKNWIALGCFHDEGRAFIECEGDCEDYEEKTLEWPPNYWDGKKISYKAARDAQGTQDEVRSIYCVQRTYCHDCELKHGI